MTKEVLENIKKSITYSEELAKEEKNSRIVDLMYQNIWNIILINLMHNIKTKNNEINQNYGMFLEDQLMQFMILISEDEYNQLVNRLKEDGFIFTYIPSNDKTLISISLDQILYLGLTAKEKEEKKKDNSRK